MGRVSRLILLLICARKAFPIWKSESRRAFQEYPASSLMPQVSLKRSPKLLYFLATERNGPMVICRALSLEPSLRPQVTLVDNTVFDCRRVNTTCRFLTNSVMTG